MQSQEGAALVDVQTTALFGNLRELQSQMQTAVGQDATSIEDLMQKVQVHNCCAFTQKHFHNVEKRFYCPQAFLRLDFQCREYVSELK